LEFLIFGLNNFVPFIFDIEKLSKFIFVSGEFIILIENGSLLSCIGDMIFLYFGKIKF
jgi:hypothetical protein